MPKGTNQKLKLYYLMKIMLEKTDDEHSLTMPQVLSALEGYGVTAERKSIYTDFDALCRLGIEIIKEPHGKTSSYHVGSRLFELAELKLLVDAIQSSKFITEKKSNRLIKKLESLVSEYQAGALQRQVYVSGRIKTMNESIYYNVDAVHSAITHNKMIRFQYYQWNSNKEMELKHNGKYYEISPWGLSWADENYYMIGYDSEAEKIKHFRVDKMLKIQECDQFREGREIFEKIDMPAYTKQSFGMFSGELRRVKLLVENRLAGVMIDRFGKDVIMVPHDEEHFTISVEVRVSSQFFGWVFALGDGVKIIAPDDIVKMAREQIHSLLEQYS